MDTTDIYEMNSTLKTSAINMDFINYQQLLYKPSQQDSDNSFCESPNKEKVCYDSISESKTKNKLY